MISDDDLFDEAMAAAERAYSPYSRVRVGAVVESSSGARFSGCNVENASYGLTVCAERVAIFSMAAAGHRRLSRVAVCVVGADGTALSPEPCGACLQCMAEFGADELPIITGHGVVRTLADHLPRPFRLAPGTPETD